MTVREERSILSPELLIKAYSRGLFPMHDPDEGIQWHWPQQRAVIPLDQVEPNKRLRQTLRQAKWKVTRDTCFEEVMRACAERESTWINEEIIEAYTHLHLQGAAHSVEAHVDGELVGGIYGVALGSAFFGESMFNRVDNAAKVAFYHLIDHLKKQNFQLFDSQYINPFTRKLGAVEVPDEVFQELLSKALSAEARW